MSEAIDLARAALAAFASGDNRPEGTAVAAHLR
jgi:hypothetical protein